MSAAPLATLRAGSFIVQAGQRFGRYTVIDELARRGHNRMVRCLCDCGNERIAYLSNLMKGTTQSCGCYMRERARDGNTTHGESRSRSGHLPTPEFTTWDGIKRRCLNTNCKSYKDYGGRGITIWEGWRENFPAFLEHVGRKPTSAHSIERINNDRGYEPGNVRWATRKEQNRNTRTTIWIEFRGEKKPLAEWAESVGMAAHTVHARLFSYGWSVERALTEPAWIGKNQSNKAVL